MRERAEDRFAHGLFEGDWSYDRVRFPEALPTGEEMKAFFARVRALSWLWFILEHELHHRGQVWGYLRDMGRTPPFYALPLPPGERPDVKAREALGGF